MVGTALCKEFQESGDSPLCLYDLLLEFAMLKMSAMPCMVTKASPTSNGTDHNASEVANQNANDLLERLGDDGYNKGSR